MDINGLEPGFESYRRQGGEQTEVGKKVYIHKQYS